MIARLPQSPFASVSGDSYALVGKKSLAIACIWVSLAYRKHCPGNLHVVSGHLPKIFKFHFSRGRLQAAHHIKPYIRNDKGEADSKS
mmetsp:Transcript_10670/g.20724  ORF Transcript_10670/g.20724 Transcript_10670/m.20724 type:complete len:87 (+) Transcript_10670:1-261(+)